jgi:hypothetical protein
MRGRALPPVMGEVLREPQVWERMCAAFPWVADECGDIGAGLIHLEFAALRRGLAQAVGSSDMRTIRAVLAFVEDLLAVPETHPEVVNAIEVSFFEDLYLGDPLHHAVVAERLGPFAKLRWDEIIASHRDGAG